MIHPKKIKHLFQKFTSFLSCRCIGIQVEVLSCGETETNFPITGKNDESITKEFYVNWVFDESLSYVG